MEPFSARWRSWDGGPGETVEVQWDNGGWTAQARNERLDLTYVVRFSPTWHARQFLLFRDFDEPDLWLATDGGGRWGEMNGAHRTDLDGCTDLSIVGSPFSLTMPLRRLPLHVGDRAEVITAEIDTELLVVLPVHERYTRVADRQWSKETVTAGTAVDWAVDDHGLVVDLAGAFRRADPD